MYEVELSSNSRAHRFNSEETAVHRYDKGVSGYREGVSRCLSTSQIVLGRYRCTDQTLRGAFLLDMVTALLTYLSQECQDVEEKLGDLVPWLTKLKGSMAIAHPDDNRDEVERREQLTRYVLHTYDLTD